MPFDVAGARAAGYSDAEIASFLGSQSGFDVEGATKAGYQPAEVIGYLSELKAPDHGPAVSINTLDGPLGVASSTSSTDPTFTASAPTPAPDAGAGRGFVNPPNANQRETVKQTADRLDRNMSGAAIAGVRDMGAAAGIATLAPAKAIDFVHSLITGKDETGAQDYVGRSFIDPNISAAEHWAPSEADQPNIVDKVVNGLARMAPTFAAAAATGGASAPTLPTYGMEAVKDAVLHGMRSMSVPAFSAGIDKSAELIRQGAPLQEAITAGLTEGATSDVTGGLAMSAPGANVAKRFVQGAAVGASTGDVSRQAENLAAPDFQTQRTPEGLAVSALTGGVLAAGMAHPTPHDNFARPSDAAEPVRGTEAADPITKIAAAPDVDSAIAAAHEALSEPLADPVHPQTLEQQLAALQKQKAADVSLQVAPDAAVPGSPGERGAVDAGSLEPGGLLDRSPAGDLAAAAATVASRAEDAPVGVHGDEPVAVEPAKTWFGRAGDGYKTIGDAQMALPSRQKVDANLDWRVETMPNGKFRLAGYEGATDKGPEAAATGAAAAPADIPVPAEAKPLSLGLTPNSTEPVTVRNGVIYVGKNAALNFDSGEPIKVAAGASDAEIKQALKDGGALSKRQKFFGGQTAALAAPVLESLGKTGGPGPAGGKTARSRAYDANPFKAFLGQHGLPLSERAEFTPGLTERRQAMVPGYGPIFRGSGKPIDTLAHIAMEDGFLRPGEPDGEAKLREMIGAVLRGERIAPLYAEGVAESEMQARVDRQRELEQEVAGHGELHDLTAYDLEAEGYGRADPELQARVRALIAQAEAGGIDHESILEDVAKKDQNASQDEYHAAASQALQAALAEPGGAGAQDRGRAAGEKAPEPQGQAEGVAPTERYAAGNALTKQQRREVLRTLTDVYKTKGAPREQKGVGRDGNERYGYVHSPDLFDKSDITGAMVRYHVTLPDGRRAHPSELFPDFTQAEIDKAMLEQGAAEKQDAASQAEVERRAEKYAAPSPAAAEQSFLQRNLGFDMRGRSFVNFEKDGRYFSVVHDDTAHIKRLERAGWTRAGDTLTAPSEADVLAQQRRAEQGERQAAQHRSDGDNRARADAQRDGFSLTGSDRAADADPDQAPMFSRAEPFYSALSHEVQGINAKAQPADGWRAQIQGLIAKGKVKADEVAWTGLDDWIKMQSGKVTKEQIGEFLKANGVQVKDVTLGGARTVRQSGKLFEVVNADGSLDSRYSREDEARAVAEGTTSPTKYTQYTLPGGTNYREVLLTLPVKQQGAELSIRRREDGRWGVYRGEQFMNDAATHQAAESLMDGYKRIGQDGVKDDATYRSGHFDQPNILAHIRLNDRTDADGKKVLFVEEIQSDWAQQGKKEGFDNEAAFQKLIAARDAAPDDSPQQDAFQRQIDDMQRNGSKGVPSAPFVGKTDAWVSLAIKRIVKMAVDEGYDKVAFVNGEQSADRYDLSKQISRVRFEDNHALGVGGADMEGPHTMGRLVAYDLDGKRVIDRQVIDAAKELPDLIGKEAAAKLLEQPGRSERTGGGNESRVKELSGLELKVGGEGMKAFYDKIVPSVAKDVIRKLGGEGLTSMDMEQRNPKSNPYFGNEPFNPSDARVIERTRGVFQVWVKNANGVEQLRGGGNFNSRDAADAFIKTGGRGEVAKQVAFDITPAMRDKAAGGMPLFKRSSLTSPGARGAMPAAQVHEALAPALAKLKIPYAIHQSTSDAARAVGMDIPDNAKGFHWRGKIHLIGDALSSKLEAQEVFWHEVQHAGLNESLGTGSKVYEDALRDIALKNANIRQAAKGWFERYGEQEYDHWIGKGRSADEAMMRTKLQAVDEALAELSGRKGEQINGIAKFVAKVQDFLHSIGLHDLANWLENRTDSEALSMILGSREAVMGEPSGQGSGQLSPAFSKEQAQFSRGEENPSFSRGADEAPERKGLIDKLGAGYSAYGGVEQVPRESRGSVADSIAKALIPAGRKDAELTAGIIRSNLGEQARGREVAQQHLIEFAKQFDKLPVADNYRFIDAMERGVPLKDPELSKAAVAIRKVLDERRDQVIALGKGNLENFNENYFPHIWKDKTAASNFFTRRPLEGGKGFLKQRTYDFFSDGIKAGLEPVTTNPVELAMLKAREMDRYIYGQRIFAEMKDAGAAKFVAFGAKAPDGWVKINDKIARVMQYSEAEKAMILRGEYYAPEQAATLINNHLSPGLSGVAAFDMIRKAGNMMNAAQLGLSAFHLGFTTLDAMISKAALGIKQVSRGDLFKGAGNMAQALNPVQPLMNLYKGDKLLRAYLGRLDDPEMAPLVEALTQAGGRVKMDDVYRNAAVNEFRQAIRKGNYGTAALKAIPRAMDLINKPIFEWLVPRQKLGVFFDMAKDAMENKPGMDVDEKRAVMGKLWDSVDNRMGELVYDNVFWNRALKDALMVSVRSVGWNLGTFREIGGGVKDLKDIPKLGGLSDRSAYIFALSFTTAVLGSLTQYLMTGEGPRELKDVFFPRTGKQRPDGTEDRLSLPSYMKDIYEYGHDLRNFAKYGEDPFHTLENKLHPLISTMGQIFTNKDFFGGAIRSPGDSTAQQALDESTFLLKQMTPFSLRNYQQQAKLKGEEPSIAGYLSSPSMIGITPAPGYITKSDAQAESSQVNKMRESLVTKFREEMRDGADWSEVRQRAMDAGLRGQDLDYIRKSAVQRAPRRMKEFATH